MKSKFRLGLILGLIIGFCIGLAISSFLIDDYPEPWWDAQWDFRGETLSNGTIYYYYSTFEGKANQTFFLYSENGRIDCYTFNKTTMGEDTRMTNYDGTKEIPRCPVRDLKHRSSK